MKRWGKNGPFIGCTDYPECKYTRDLGRRAATRPKTASPSMTDYECDECGSR